MLLIISIKKDGNEIIPSIYNKKNKKEDELIKKILSEKINMPDICINRLLTQWKDKNQTAASGGHFC
jgi:hypothetical protein